MIRNLVAATLLLVAGMACGVSLIARGGPPGREDAQDESQAAGQRGEELEEFISELPENAEPPPKSEAAVWEAYLQTLEDHYRHVNALYQAGRQGGEARDLARVAYELASARAALARARGDEAEARKWIEQGLLRARRYAAAAAAEYETGTGNEQGVLDAARVYRDASLAAVRAHRDKPR